MYGPRRRPGFPPQPRAPSPERGARDASRTYLSIEEDNKRRATLRRVFSAAQSHRAEPISTGSIAEEGGASRKLLVPDAQRAGEPTLRLVGRTAFFPARRTSCAVSPVPLGDAARCTPVHGLSASPNGQSRARGFAPAINEERAGSLRFDRDERARYLAELVDRRDRAPFSRLRRRGELGQLSEMASRI